MDIRYSCDDNQVVSIMLNPTLKLSCIVAANRRLYLFQIRTLDRLFLLPTTHRLSGRP